MTRPALLLSFAGGAALGLALCFGAMAAWLYLGAQISSACGLGPLPGVAVTFLLAAVGLARLLSAKFARAGLL
ncbi:hypothetical protein [Methylobacterium organophilum]|uniref:Uncharacterized protein n=1 Tax=Methylobacterium organophilum TaxID=410 RepID=A0ABQ4THG0_METOR|nr:hypothetical protein [Methylobacterium organophilum]GJE29762.1 hypothetical protein LKMONMHP_4648 [Methylobacterium organophilum]